MPPSPGKDHVFPRGANDVLRLPDRRGRTYCPRAMWTQSEGHPLKGDSDEESYDGAGKNYLIELQREAYKDVRMRKYVKDSLKKQMKDRSDLRQMAKMEIKGQADACLKDAERYEAEEQRKKEKHKSKQAEELIVRDQQCALARQAQQTRQDEEKKEAQEIRALGEKMKREDARLKKKQKANAQAEFARTMSDLKQLEEEKKATLLRENEAHKLKCAEGLEEGNERERARKQLIADFQAKTEKNMEIYSATAGKMNHERETRETRRVDKDEREHYKRMGDLYARRERLRDAQQQDMVRCLAEQVKEKSQQRQNLLIQTQVEARALEEDARRSLEEDLRRYRQRKEDQKDLHHELQRMMQDKMSQENGSMLSTLGSSQRGGIDQLNLSTRMDASRFVQKPLGRIEVQKPLKKSLSMGKLSMTLGIMERDRKLEASPWREAVKLRKSGSHQMLRSSY